MAENYFETNTSIPLTLFDVSNDINQFKINQASIKNLIKKVKFFKEDIKKFGNYKDFRQKLETQIITIRFGNILFIDGFYDFDKDVTIKFLYDDEMEWGGFYGSKLDSMHFGLKYSKIGSYLKK